MSKITKKNIQVADFLRDQMLHWNLLYDLLTREFIRFKFNKDIHEIGYKVELVDKLCNCQLRHDIRIIANAILILDLDSEFEESKATFIVNKIANIQIRNQETFLNTNNKRLGEEFASKYCHFHYPHKFPIIDEYVKIGLSNLLSKKPPIIINHNYAQFMHEITELKKDLGFEVTNAQLNSYLWLYGNWVEYGSNPCSLEFWYLVEDENDSVQGLSPEI